jgi:hypothetical protein
VIPSINQSVVGSFNYPPWSITVYFEYTLYAGYSVHSLSIFGRQKYTELSETDFASKQLFRAMISSHLCVVLEASLGFIIHRGKDSSSCQDKNQSKFSCSSCTFIMVPSSVLGWCYVRKVPSVGMSKECSRDLKKLLVEEVVPLTPKRNCGIPVFGIALLCMCSFRSPYAHCYYMTSGLYRRYR